MQRLFVVDGNLFTRMDIAQSKEQHMSMDCAHLGVGFARVIDVMRTVTTPTAVDAPDAVHVADTEFGSMGAALCFPIRNAFSGVFGDLAPVRKVNSCKTASAVNG